jgi:hypothetical protein
LKITVFFWQSSLLLVRTVGVGLPGFVSQLFQHSSNAASISVAAIECVFVGIPLSTRYLVYMLTPVVLLALSGLVYVAGRLYQCRPGVKLLHWQGRCGYLALHFLQLTYFDVVVKAFGGVSCTLSDPSGQTFLNQYPWVACSLKDETFRIVGPLSAVSLLVYGLGVPGFCLLLLLRRRTRLAAESTQVMLGFVYNCYRPEMFFWELVVTMKRVLLACALAVVPFQQPGVTVLSVLAVFQVRWLSCFRFRFPHERCLSGVDYSSAHLFTLPHLTRESAAAGLVLRAVHGLPHGLHRSVQCWHGRVAGTHRCVRCLRVWRRLDRGVARFLCGHGSTQDAGAS